MEYNVIKVFSKLTWLNQKIKSNKAVLHCGDFFYVCNFFCRPGCNFIMQAKYV